MLRSGGGQRGRKKKESEARLSDVCLGCCCCFGGVDHGDPLGVLADDRRAAGRLRLTLADLV